MGPSIHSLGPGALAPSPNQVRVGVLQRRSRHPQRRSGCRASRRDPDSLHSVSDTAARWYRQDNRGHQHARRRQRAQTGRDSAADFAERVEPSCQKQYADIANTIGGRGSAGQEPRGPRIAMAAAQRVLYRTTDATRFDACDFLRAVCETARQTFPQELDLDCEADSIQLSNDAAMPLALIANELLTNAVKYGLNGRGAGTVRVRLKREEDDSFLFYVEDDGPGFDLQSIQRRSSGLALVQGLARRLGGEI
jgi:signal transduction histidine kinase